MLGLPAAIGAKLARPDAAERAAAGAILALPAAAMIQALAGEWGERHEVVDSLWTDVETPDLATPDEP